MLADVKLTKDGDPDKNYYQGNGIGFDSRSLFSFSNFNWVKNVTLRADNSSSVHIDNKRKEILVIGKGTTKIR